MRKASATTQGATLDVITGPSEVSDSEEEGEDDDGDDSSSNNSEESSTNSTTTTTATTEEQEPEADSSSHGGAPVPLPPVIRGMSGGAGQDPTLNTAALDMLVTVDDADNEDNESIVNEAVAVGEEEDEVIASKSPVFRQSLRVFLSLLGRSLVHGGHRQVDGEQDPAVRNHEGVLRP